MRRPFDTDLLGKGCGSGLDGAKRDEARDNAM